LESLFGGVSIYIYIYHSWVKNVKFVSPAVVPQSVVEAIINQGFPALANTTKAIPASVFSYRFASPTNNQTPYYISSDIVLRYEHDNLSCYLLIACLILHCD
jgi:hypothetical protein